MKYQKFLLSNTSAQNSAAIHLIDILDKPRFILKHLTPQVLHEEMQFGVVMITRSELKKTTKLNSDMKKVSSENTTAKVSDEDIHVSTIEFLAVNLPSLRFDFIFIIAG